MMTGLDKAQLVEPEIAISAVLDELLWFAIGFAVIQGLIYFGFMPKKYFGFLAPIGGKENKAPKRRLTGKLRCTAGSAGKHSIVLEAWDCEKSAGPLPLDTLQDAARALSLLAPERLASELIAHLACSRAAYPQPVTTNALLEAVVQSSRPDLAETFAKAAEEELGVNLDSRTREILIGAFAAAGDEGKVQEIEGKESNASADDAVVRSHLLAIKGFLKCGKLDAALQRIVAMRSCGSEVPPRAITELFKAACHAGPDEVQRMLDGLSAEVQLPLECLALLLSDCLQREDIDLARRLDRVVTDQKTRMHHSIYEPLLKLFAKSGDARACEIFQQIHQEGFDSSEGLCGSLLARCGEGQNLRFAEIIVEYLRGRSMMTLAIFKTLMKVYVCSGRYDSACDLYEQVLAAGLEPDHVMYGCLVKFAVKCGRTELSQELFKKSQGSDIQSYMCLIREAGREGNVARAIELLRQVEGKQKLVLDPSLYNCTMDACVTNNGMDQARALLAEMSERGLANIITYNTLMKGYGANGDFAGARRVIREMEDARIKPDSASYNCLMGYMVSAGNLVEAWKVLDEMDRKGVQLDHYTVSIMMKAAKKARNPRDASRALAVLDRAGGVKVCEDDVLFNTVLDACIHRQDTERLRKVLETFASSDMKPSVHTYGLLIKAFSTLRQLSRCWQLWREMVETRELVPNSITLSCMLDALICAREVNKGVALLKEWKGKVTLNTVMYSTLIKGFAIAGEADRAMDIYRELRADGLQMNLVAYTSLIDAHARAGKMEQARKLFEQMEEEGCEPNVITFSAIVKGHCNVGDVDEAFSVFRSMLSRGLSADTVIFNTLLDGCVKHWHFELADQLLGDMATYGVIPSKFTLSIIVKMWGKRQELDKAFEAVYSSLRDGHTCLDAQVGTCLISVCLHNNAVSRAIKVLEEMKTWRGCSGPDESSYSMLISGLARRGDCHRAVEVAWEACEAAAAPRSTMKALSEECLRALFTTLRRHGLAEDLGARLAAKLRTARMQVPKGIEVVEGETPSSSRASYEQRAAPAQSLTRPCSRGNGKFELAWMKARRATGAAH